ncbi:hypothetical protein INT44_006332 [Umbelopsis vinacea]|uniref:Uncharacterized protein n=1 Tax=Umbelopsis vinacea TaxID=44442 RepID=A0A8H7PSX2_9FUNG|nr:hypothetical protein INT44_006332 [Umbelopsis vinacea]KAI9286341.1 hypothetical protein BC943DRAFT_17567 [Umbelopsis sp. AD052]
MTLVGSVAGFATLGFTVRAYALGIQKRPLLEGISGHFLTAGAFGAVGYWVYNLQNKQVDQIERKKQLLLSNRARAEQSEDN